MKNPLRWIRAADLIPWPGLNPRKRFNEEKHAQLVASIRRGGVHEPLLVHDTGASPLWVVAGERRLRAASELGPDTQVPCMVREYSETDALEIALIENLDRDDLSAIEEARGFRRLLEQPGLTQRKLAERVGRTQPYISNRIRLLELPDAVLELVEDGAIEISHARDLLLPFARIPEAKRTRLFADIAKQVRKRKEPIDDRELKRIVGDVAKKLSRPITDPDYGEKHAPRFDANLHAGTKATPGCSCQGPRFEYGWRKSVRCFDDAWWDAAQAAAIEAETQAEAAAAAEFAEQGDGAVRVLKRSAFEAAFKDSYRLPSIESGREPIDAKHLAGAAMVIVARHGRYDVVCTDEGAYRKAKSAATKERNRALAAKKVQRAEKIRKDADAAALESWMLMEILAERPYDDAVIETARDLGIAMQKPRKDAWNWLDDALRKLSIEDGTRLFKALALRAKAKDLTDHKLTQAVDGQVRRKFGPGVTALRKKVLEAAGIDPAAKPEQDANDADDFEGDVDEAECVKCGCSDYAACPEGCAWVVVDRNEGVGVCSSCAASEEDAQQLLEEARAAA